MAVEKPLIMTVLPVCPYCGAHDVAFYLKSTHVGAAFTTSFWICGGCTHAVIIESAWIDTSGKRDMAGDVLVLPKNKTVIPAPPACDAPRGTPDDIAADFREAKSCLFHKNIKAACILARSALETTAVRQGAVKGGLRDKIRFMAREHIITPALAEWAEEIKDIGNDAAHAAERRSDLTLEDARDAINFLEMLLTYLYSLPDMIAERRGRGNV